jgi:hypothetical protein
VADAEVSHDSYDRAWKQDKLVLGDTRTVANHVYNLWVHVIAIVNAVQRQA